MKTSPAKTSTVAVELVRALRNIGVRFVFGVPSGGWIDYMDAIRQVEGIDFILTTHEGGAAMMAEVCGRLGGAPGVCFGTLGPGATNLSTGVGEALLDRSPMLALTDEMPAAMRGRTTQMGIDHQALFRPLTKHTTRLARTGVRETVSEAARVALSERPGPVHIGLPLGLSADTVVDIGNATFALPSPPPPAAQTKIDQAVALFTSAQRPILAVGLGAVRANVGKMIAELAHRHELPVVITPMAKGILSESDPSYAGVLFHALSDIVGETHSQADLIVGIGYDPVEFNYESWVNPAAKIVSLDTVPADIDTATYNLAVDVVGDIRNSLAALLALPGSPRSWNLEDPKRRRDAMFERLAPAGDGFGPKAVLEILRDVLPDDAVMTCDVGAHTHLIGQVWRTPAPGLQIMKNGWSTMGFGIPSAIAAKLSMPDKTVCTVVGDGGFLMTVGELVTARRYGVPFITVLLTDNDLALIRIKQEKRDYPVYGTPVRDGGTLSGGNDVLGVPLEVVRNGSQLRAALTKAIQANALTIIEAVVDSREYDDVVLKKDKR